MIGVAVDPSYPGLKHHLIATTGLAFYADRDQELAELIGQRLADLRLRDCFSYSEFLAKGAGGKAEMDILIAQLTVGETYFFRDPEQFAAIRDIILPDILERNRCSKQLRIWSAGCASGAEPYSLALLLSRELAHRLDGWRVEIYATDLNRSYLAQAARGQFRPSALRSTSEEVKRECFSNEGTIWTIHPRYKQWISFHYMNLAENEFSPLFTVGAHFDLILCRNVMIYFAPAMNRRLIGQFHQSLGDGGWLLVGGTEHNLENYKEFRTMNASGARLYQKIALPLEDHSGGGIPDPPPAPSPAFSGKPSGGPAPDQGGRSTNATDMDQLRQLADRGDWRAAADCGQKLLEHDQLNPSIHFYQALIFENLGIPGESERSLRQAIYLDRNFALAHYHLGLALKRDRRMPAAARCFRNVLKVLASRADNEIVVAGPGISATGLKELAEMHLESSGGS